MAWTLFIAACCLLALHAEGAPKTAVYKFVKCRPEGERANCVTQQSPPMEWSPDLPTKLPASSAQYLDGLPLEEEGLTSESTEVVQPEDGSGYEGSAGPLWMDYPFDTNIEQEMGSGESLTNMDRSAGRLQSEALRWVFGISRQDQDRAAEKEMQEDHFLQL
ncbi:serglycin [Vanacampus margaritifer]